MCGTDDAETSEIAKSGAEVPFMRPKEISEDNTPGIEPALHTIKKYQTLNGCYYFSPHHH